MMNLRSEYEKLLSVVADGVPIAVAFSGGADSSLLLKAAIDVFGNQTTALFANSVLQTPADRDNAVYTAAKLGATLQVVEIFPLEWSQFTANPPERCYYCKKKIYSLFKKHLSNSETALADGSNLDDLGQKRPGHRAIEELGILRPLVEAGLGKTKIRSLGKYLGVPSWDRESASCLATRIPSGQKITEQRLQDIAQYERILNNAGFTGCRVRGIDGDSGSVRIEVKKDDLEMITGAMVRKKLSAEFGSLGIEKLYLDLAGRS